VIVEIQLKSGAGPGQCVGEEQQGPLAAAGTTLPRTSWGRDADAFGVRESALTAQKHGFLAHAGAH